MFKYTKSLMTVALALTCSLSLVSCGGGGGGGGGGAATAPENGGNTGGNTGNNNTSKPTEPEEVHYAPETLSKSMTFKGSRDFFLFYPDGFCRYGYNGQLALRYDGRWSYTKTGPNTARLSCNNLVGEATTYNFSGTLTFHSDNQVTYSASYTSQSYSGKTTNGTLYTTYTIEY